MARKLKNKRRLTAERKADKEEAERMTRTTKK